MGFRVSMNLEQQDEGPQDALVCGSSLVSLLLGPAAAAGSVQCAMHWDEFFAFCVYSPSCST